MAALVLVAEDDSHIRSLLELYLGGAGFRVIGVADGRLALETARRERPDLILLDLMMPEMDGLTFLREYRKEGAAPVVVLSAQPDKRDAARALGATDYIVKPFSPAQLATRLQTILGHPADSVGRVEAPALAGPPAGRPLVDSEEPEVAMRPYPRLVTFLLILILAVAAYQARTLFASPDPPLESAVEEAAPIESDGVAAALLPSPTASPRPSPTLLPTPDATVTPYVIPYGSVIRDGKVLSPTPLPTPPPRLLPESMMMDQYASAEYASLDEMPEELAFFVRFTVEDIATFFGVRSEDLLALLAARGGGRLRVAAPETEPGGVAALSTRLWNGWAAADHGRYLNDQRGIEQSGGLGFDWSSRWSYDSWLSGGLRAGSVMGLEADPAEFSDTVAALARHLLREGLSATAPAPDAARIQSAAAALDQSAVSGAAVLSTPLRGEFFRLMDRSFAVALSENDLVTMVDRSPVAAAVDAGAQGAQEGAAQLLNETIQRYMSEGVAARDAGRALPWPFVTSAAEVEVQLLAARHLGHILTRPALEAIIDEHDGVTSEIESALLTRVEATLLTETRALMDERLGRSAAGQPLYNHEVMAIVGPALAANSQVGYSSRYSSRFSSSNYYNREQARLLSEVEAHLRRLPEYRARHGDLFFTAYPLDPMPRSGQPFGVPVSYQPDGFHTGLDLRGSRVGGQQAPLYAMADGVVTYVGPLYCLREGACRGPYAVVIDHGSNVYAIYSHNSEATVQAGERVVAGQMIGRQGSEGYSRGPHLHLEIHVGAPFSGDWTVPWTGGRFVDPWPWLPLPDEVS